jgi:hypothetical protein
MNHNFDSYTCSLRVQGKLCLFVQAYALRMGGNYVDLHLCISRYNFAPILEEEEDKIPPLF